MRIYIMTTFQDALIHKIGIWVTTSMIAAGMPSIGARMVHRPMNGFLEKERNILRITVAHAEREHKVCNKLLYWRSLGGFSRMRDKTFSVNGIRDRQRNFDMRYFDRANVLQ